MGTRSRLSLAWLFLCATAACGDDSDGGAEFDPDAIVIDDVSDELALGFDLGVGDGTDDGDGDAVDLRVDSVQDPDAETDPDASLDAMDDADRPGLPDAELDADARDDADATELCSARRGGMTLLSPADGAEVCGRVPLFAQLPDDSSGLTVEFRVADVTVAEDDEAPYEGEWDTRGLAPGQYAVTARALDGVRDVGSDCVTVTVTASVDCDNPPTLRITAPDPDAFVRGRLDVAAAATDDFGVTEVQFFVDRGLISDDNSVPFSALLNTGTFDDGEHELSAVAHDTAGQTARDAFTITIDNTPPAVAITAPERGEMVAESVRVEAEVSDALGVRTVRLRLDERDEIALAGPPYAFDLGVASLESGIHRVTVTARDVAGNLGEDTRQFVVDRPPSVEIVAPADGAELDAPVPIEVDASDDLGLPVVVLYVDGEPEATRDGSGAFAWNPPFEARDYLLEVLATDSRGQTAGDAVTVALDRPLTLFVSLCGDGVCVPLEDGLAVSGEVAFLVEAEDDEGALAIASLFVDSVRERRDFAAPFELVWNTSELDPGEYAIEIRGRSTRDEVASLFYTLEVVEEGGCTSLLCDCEGIPTVVNPGEFCFSDDQCIDGACVVSDILFGTCQQLCSPGFCVAEVCGTGICIPRLDSVTGEPLTFPDGRPQGTCIAATDPDPPTGDWDACAEGIDSCASDSDCFTLRDTRAMCFPQCDLFGDCPSREGFAGECLVTNDAGSATHCVITCEIAGFPLGCPTGMSCTAVTDDVNVCVWP